MWQRREAQARRGRGPLVIGHRGASALAPENSLAAFARAARDGADGVELDVLCCATGEVVVFHDDDLARLAGRPDRVDALSLAELRAVTPDAGRAHPDARGGVGGVRTRSAGQRRAQDPRLRRAADRGRSSSGSRRSSSAPARRRACSCRRSTRAPCACGCAASPAVPAALLFERAEAAAAARAWAAPGCARARSTRSSSLCTPERVRALARARLRRQRLDRRRRGRRARLPRHGRRRRHHERPGRDARGPRRRSSRQQAVGRRRDAEDEAGLVGGLGLDDGDPLADLLHLGARADEAAPDGHEEVDVELRGGVEAALRARRARRRRGPWPCRAAP